QEGPLFHGSRGPDDLGMVVDVDRISDSRRRNERGSGGSAREERPPLQIRLTDLTLPIREQPELDHVLRTGVLAVEAHVALVLAPLHAALRAVGPLAIHEAQIAICALC